MLDSGKAQLNSMFGVAMFVVEVVVLMDGSAAIDEYAGAGVRK